MSLHSFACQLDSYAGCKFRTGRGEQTHLFDSSAHIHVHCTDSQRIFQDVRYPLFFLSFTRLTHLGNKNYTRDTMRFLAPRSDVGPGTRISRRLLLLSVTLGLQSAVPVTNASVQSIDLRAEHLLFWSGLDCAVDAALHNMGPLLDDLLLRGGDQPTETTSETTCVSERPMGSSPVYNNHTLDHPPSSMSTTMETLDDNRETSVATVKAPENTTTLSLKERVRNIPVSDKSRMQFSLFQPGDGSREDPDGIPTRYLKMQKGDRELAAKALEATLDWRDEHAIDTILKIPHRKFEICKQVFPHYFVGRDKDDHVVFVQRPAMLDLEKAKANGLTNEELLLHYVYVNEFLWQYLEADSPLGTMTSVIDLQGLHLGVLRQSDIISFLKKFVMTMDAHFPQRSHKTLILNAPKWFHMLYKLISPLLRDTTKAKIEIHSRSKKQDAVLKDYLGEDAAKKLPPSFWSKKHTKRQSRHRRGHNEEHSLDADDDGSGSAVPSDDPTEVSEMEEALRSFVSIMLL
jgi:hypothetical protein